MHASSDGALSPNLAYGDGEACPGTLGGALLVLEDDVEELAVVDGPRVAGVGLGDELAQLEGGLGLTPLLEHDVELERLQGAALVVVVLDERVPVLHELVRREVLPELQLHQPRVIITHRKRGHLTCFRLQLVCSCGVGWCGSREGQVASASRRRATSRWCRRNPRVLLSPTPADVSSRQKIYFESRRARRREEGDEMSDCNEPSSEDEIERGLFEEPEDFYKPPPQPTHRTYHRKCGEDGTTPPL
jgi:hypothetical protein